MEKGKKILLGLSGGVDSAVALYLLIKQGYDVEAGFMRNWDAYENKDILGNPTLYNNVCPQEQDYLDAKKVADQFGIKLHNLNFTKEYWNDVFLHFLSEYEEGRTPNPDIFCNKFIKFDAFLKYAIDNGFDYVATGHYATKKTINGKNYLYKANDKNKDQSYFLSQINSYQLDKSLFPLGEYNKEEIRKIAKELEIFVATKKDSTGVCFIGERDFSEFLKNYLPMQKGDIIAEETNEKLGNHEGVFFYTIGQRKGLNIGGNNKYPTGSWFVSKKDIKNNILYVVQNKKNLLLRSDLCYVDSLNFLNFSLNVGEIKTCFAKFRYRQNDIKVSIKLIDNNLLEVRTLEETYSITPGQAAVFYEDDLLLCGGIIKEVYFENKRRN